MPSERQQNKGTEVDSERPCRPRGTSREVGSARVAWPLGGPQSWAQPLLCLLWGLSMPHSGISASEAPGQVLEPSDSPARPGQRVAPSPVTPWGGGGSWRLDATSSYPFPMLRHPHGTRRLLGIAGSPGRPTLRRGCPGPPGACCLLRPQGHEAGRPWVLATAAGFLPTVLWVSQR